ETLALPQRKRRSGSSECTQPPSSRGPRRRKRRFGFIKCVTNRVDEAVNLSVRDDQGRTKNDRVPDRSHHQPAPDADVSHHRTRSSFFRAKSLVRPRSRNDLYTAYETQ